MEGRTKVRANVCVWCVCACVRACVRACVCVCVRERERERVDREGSLSREKHIYFHLQYITVIYKTHHLSVIDLV